MKRPRSIGRAPADPRSWAAALALLVCCASAPIARGAPPAETLSGEQVSPKTEGSIGVAPFERVGAVGETWPDVAALLAARLGTRGVERVVGPEKLSEAAGADPGAEQVVAWAREAGVGALVVGRTTRLGTRLSVDARLRSASSGAALGSPFYVEVARVEDLGPAVDSLAAQVLARLEAPPSAVSSAPSSPEATEPAPRRRNTALSSDEPIQIKSDELDAQSEEGRRRFVFTGNVRAVQGDVTLTSKRLEAFYPSGQSQPDRLVATGKVVILQGERRAECDRAVFRRTENTVVCTGHAQLDQGCDRVSGQEIVFEIDSETMKVSGAADVRIHPKGSPCDSRAEARP